MTVFFAAQLFLANLTAQGFKVSVTAGAGTYRMQSMKAFIEMVNESLPFTPEVVDEFPPYFWYAADASMIKGDFTWGLTINYNSTGSRVSLKDYSGEYLSDRKLIAVSPGISAGYLLPTFGDRMSLTPVADLGLLISGMEVDETMVVGGEIVSDFHNNYSALNFYASPSVRFAWAISSLVSMELKTGYLLQFGGGQFKSKAHRGSGLGIYHVTPDWTGLRCGLSVVISLPKKTGAKQEVL